MKKIEKPRSRFAPRLSDLRIPLLSSTGVDDGPAPRWGWPELFIIVQYVSTGLLFLPGTQPFRSLIRALPYLMSGFLLLYYMYHWHRQRKAKWKAEVAARAHELEEGHTGESMRARSVQKEKFPFHGMQGWLAASILVLILGWIFHPNSHFQAGLGQVMFQAMIVAPAFWAVMVVKNRKHLIRLLVLTFATNFVSASLGVLQVYYPDTFNPVEFTSADPEILKRLVYTGPGGVEILRPCGLSDTPGYASYSGFFTGFLGIALAFAPGMPVWGRLLCIIGAALGPLVLLLTQVRSLFIVLILITAVFSFLIFLQRRLLQFQLITGIGVVLITGAVIWAVNIGGDSISGRFSFLWGQQDYKDLANERGQFWSYTLNDLLFLYPLGAGVGRWGVMQTSFNNDPTNETSSPLYVEIQVTGWLFDGGYVMWVVYPMALLFALAQIFRTSIKEREDEKSFWYAVVFALNLSAVIQAYSGPTFNTQFGIIFWFFSGAVIGLIIREKRRRESGDSDAESLPDSGSDPKENQRLKPWIEPGS